MVGIDSPRPRTSVVFWGSDNGPVKWCGGWDLNPRTPTGQGPEPCAFDLSWQPPRERKKESAFDKCLSCFGAVPVGKIRPTFDPVSGRIVLNQLPGRNTLSRR